MGFFNYKLNKFPIISSSNYSKYEHKLLQTLLPFIFTQVSTERREEIIAATVDQGDDQSGEWVLQRRGCVTASCFGEIVKCRATNAPLVQRIVHKVTRETAAIRYSNINEPHARQLYGEYLRSNCDASVEKTGFHIDIEVCISNYYACTFGWEHHLIG